MLQLVNLSNYRSEMELIRNNADVLQAFLHYNHLDGIEMMFCGEWDRRVHKKEWIHGVHLRFWPSWLDFWRSDREELLRQFSDDAAISNYYGGPLPEQWLEVYRDNIRQAQAAGARYLVFHVCHARLSEVYDWRFSATDREIITAAIEVVNALAPDIPDDMELLFENLWWPGLTLLDGDLTALLLDGVRHRNCGIMLDTGHLMNTNPELRSEAEGVDYILKTVEKLGIYRHYIKGVHLHRSLSGAYIKQVCGRPNPSATLADIMDHVLRIDEHLPFSVPEARRIIDYIQPQYVVHEFLNQSLEEWSGKVRQQQQALQWRDRL